MKIVFELDTEDSDVRQKIEELKNIIRIVEEKTKDIANDEKDKDFEKGNKWLESRQKSF